MAGQPVMLPDHTGEAIQNTIRNVLALMGMKQERDIAEARLAEDARQADQNSRNAMRATALQGLNTMVQHMPAGVKLKDLPWMHGLVSAAFDIDLGQNPQAMDWEVNKETFEQALDQIAREGLPSAGTPARAGFAEAAASQGAFGNPTSGTAQGLENARGAQAIQGAGIQAMASDPVAQEDAARALLSLPETVRAMGLKFDNPASANFYVNMRQVAAQLEAARIQAGALSSGAQAELQKAQMEALQSASENLSKSAQELGLFIAPMTAQAITAALVSPDGEAQLNALVNAQPNEQSKASVLQAIQFAQGAWATGEAQVRQALDQHPQGRAISNTLALGGAFANISGRGEGAATQLEGTVGSLQMPDVFAPFGTRNRLFGRDAGVRPPAAAATPQQTVGFTPRQLPGALRPPTGSRFSADELAAQQLAAAIDAQRMATTPEARDAARGQLNTILATIRQHRPRQETTIRNRANAISAYDKRQQRTGRP